MASKNIVAIILSFIVFFSFGCSQQIKFEKNRWSVKDDLEYPFRDKMLTDLAQNHQFIGQKYSEVILMLGNPDFIGNNSCSYKIIEKYGGDIDVVYTKSLDFTFSKDSIILTVDIHEWEK